MPGPEPETSDTGAGTDDRPTAVEIPAEAAATRRQAAGDHGSASPSSPSFTLTTLRDEEAQSTRGMIQVGRLVGLAVLLPLPFMGGSETLRLVFAGAVLFAIAVGAVVERRIRKPERYSERTMLLLAYSVAPAAWIALLQFGIFSAAQMFVALALYFFCRRESAGSALLVTVTNAAWQGGAAALVIAGRVDDPGVWRLDLPPHALVLGHLMIQVGCFGAFLLGRFSHRAARAAIERMQRAMLLAAQRDAMLQEARQDLDLALRAGGGRYTDQTFGSWRLGDVIGRGGMGEVYAASHVDRGEEAAVKLLPVRELSNPRSIERFLREVRAVSSLRSHHVVRVLEASADDDPIPYFAMERLRGEDLAQRLRGAPFGADDLDRLLRQVGEALEEAWTHGIVHRDLKPQNLFFADQEGGGGDWKVLDFGVAALRDHTGTLTQGHVVGTPAYMAPEQARGEPVDQRADVYSLAAIAYRALTGRPVVAERDLHASLYQVVHVMPQAPSGLARLHPDVDAALAVALSKDPGDRFAGAGALREALAAALAGRLDPALRHRAAELASRHPWGSVRRA